MVIEIGQLYKSNDLRESDRVVRIVDVFPTDWVRVANVKSGRRTVVKKERILDTTKHGYTLVPAALEQTSIF